MQTKRNLIIVTLTILTYALSAQKIEINIIEPEPYYEKDTINVEILLINNTSDSLIYFDTRGPSWDSFIEVWDLNVNSQFFEILPMNGAHNHNFPDSTIRTLNVNDTNFIRSRDIVLKISGQYSFTYTQEQGSKLVNKDFADKTVTDSAINSINTFSVSQNIKFDVHKRYDTTIREIVDISWKEWKAFRHVKVYTRDKFFDNIYAALRKPQDAYALLMYCNGLDAEAIKRIGRLKNLKSLTLNNYELDYFPEELSNLNLYELTILPKNETVVKFPYGISKNNTIRELRAQFYGGIPQCIHKLSDLEKLDISDCPITTLPKLDSLLKLKELNAKDTDLHTIDSCGFESLVNIININLSGNKKINSITPLLNCTNLEFLVMNRTSISEIPHDIENLSKLKKLSISNGLTVISDSIGNLSDMRYLSFGGNRKLDSVPSSIIKMTKLLHLDLSSTRIPALPEGTAELPLEKVLIYNTDCEKTKDYKSLKKQLGTNFKD